jgi:FSR family fosmidomycin resistance protein-like MFS transporter
MKTQRGAPAAIDATPPARDVCASRQQPQLPGNRGGKGGGNLSQATTQRQVPVSTLAGGRCAHVGKTVVAVLVAISVAHLVNDLLQSLIPAIYPILKTRFSLSFAQIGAITLVNQMTASVLQPLVGLYTDRRPMPYSLAAGMVFTLVGLLLLSQAGSFAALLCAVAMVGIGSSIFHPESSRVARLASGGRHGLAQSVFQVGGNAGGALGPLLAAFVVAPEGSAAAGGQGAVAWFGLVALLGVFLLAGVGGWYRQHLRRPAPKHEILAPGLSGRRVAGALAVLMLLMLSKFFYMASIGNYFTFFLIGRFHVPVRTAELALFLFMAAFVAGTMLGGPIGDRVGRKRIIWISIFGVLPFTLALPHLGFYGTLADTVPIGILLASAFPAIVVYAQELVPGRVGTVSGLMFGLAFGLGGLGAAGLGMLADHTSLTLVFDLCSALPALGMLAVLLPRT